LEDRVVGQAGDAPDAGRYDGHPRKGIDGRNDHHVRVRSPFRPDVALGNWTADGMRYEDRLFLLSIDVEDSAEHRAWIAHLKAHLLERFQQLEIYVTSYPIDTHWPPHQGSMAIPTPTSTRQAGRSGNRIAGRISVSRCRYRGPLFV